MQSLRVPYTTFLCYSASCSRVPQDTVVIMSRHRYVAVMVVDINAPSQKNGTYWEGINYQYFFSN